MSSVNDSQEVFQFPDCWKDDTRMNVLFAPFRSKSINPTDWQSKMKFWEQLIDRWCKHHKRPVISQAELINQFQRNGKVPTCLSNVVDHLLCNGILVTRDRFYQMTEQSWKNWAIQVMVANPLKWTVGKIKSTVISPVESSDSAYIHLPTVKYLGEQLIKSIPEEQQGKLIDISSVQNISGMHNLEELILVLQWLQSQQTVAIIRGVQPFELVKFPKNGIKPVKVSEVDNGIYLLEKHERNLKKNIEKLEQEKEAALNEARKYVAAKMRPMAKHSLRKKKELEKYIEKRTTALDNIQSLLYKIQQAESDSSVLESYRTGVNALKQTFKETGLTETKVNDTMDELEDILDTHNEIEATLSRSLEPSLESDLEDELEKLMLDDVSNFPPEGGSSGGDFKDDKKSVDLPDVPSNDPSLSADGLDEALLEMRLRALSS